MARENRVKEQMWTLTFSGTTTGSFCYDPSGKEVINGEILEVDWTADGAGSYDLQFARTGEEFWRRNAPSGTGIQVARPWVFPQNSAGSVANSTMIPYVTNDVVWLNVGSALSGTSFSARVRYR